MSIGVRIVTERYWNMAPGRSKFEASEWKKRQEEEAINEGSENSQRREHPEGKRQCSYTVHAGEMRVSEQCMIAIGNAMKRAILVNIL